MILIHIESGLGNQMLSYCELIALKKSNPNQNFYVETIVYDIPECHETICQWNGYELERIFNIQATNIKTRFRTNEWQAIEENVRQSLFWEKKWNYPVYITKALSTHGLKLENIRGDFEIQSNKSSWQKGWKGELRSYVADKTRIGNWLKRKILFNSYHERTSLQDVLFLKTDSDVFTGQRLSFKLRGAGIERIREEIEQTFQFPSYSSSKNEDFSKFLDSHNSVFIHARRGDMLSSNGWCYKYGYFRRAVKYIKKNVKDPVFVFFTNTGSIEWCKQNEDIFSLDFTKDEVYFVDWNSGEESFRDMQLMSHCKHGIITNSSFGWWGAFLIRNPNKITISPLVEINTTYHC